VYIGKCRRLVLLLPQEAVAAVGFKISIHFRCAYRMYVCTYVCLWGQVSMCPCVCVCVYVCSTTASRQYTRKRARAHALAKMKNKMRLNGRQAQKQHTNRNSNSNGNNTARSFLVWPGQFMCRKGQTETNLRPGTGDPPKPETRSPILYTLYHIPYTLYPIPYTRCPIPIADTRAPTTPESHTKAPCKQ